MAIYVKEIVLGDGCGEISVNTDGGINIVQMEDGVCPHTIVIMTENDTKDLIRAIRVAAMINGWEV